MINDDRGSIILQVREVLSNNRKALSIIWKTNPSPLLNVVSQLHSTRVSIPYTLPFPKLIVSYPGTNNYASVVHQKLIV